MRRALLACCALLAACPAPSRTGELDAGLPSDCPTLLETELGFGEVPSGGSAALGVTVVNPTPRLFHANFTSSASAFQAPQPFTVAAGQRVAAMVRFAPPDTRTWNGTLTLERDTRCGPQSIPLIGKGVGEFVAPGTVGFAPTPVGSSATSELTLTNVDDRPLDVQVVYPLANPIGELTGPFVVHLEPVASVTVPLRFDARSDGSFDGLLTLRGPTRVRIVAVHAMAGVPRLSFSSTSLSFQRAPVDFPIRGRVFVRNGGGGRPEFQLRDITADGGAPQELTANFLPDVNALEVMLLPHAAGPRAWHVELATNDPLTPLVALDVTATAEVIEPCLAPFLVSPSTFNLPTDGGTVSTMLTFANVGGTDCFVNGFIESDLPWELVPPQAFASPNGSTKVELRAHGPGEGRIIFEPAGSNTFPVTGAVR